MPDQVQELEAKIKIYKEELDRVTKELAIKRTELATAAKTRIEHLEGLIPELESQVSAKNAEIITRDQMLEIRNAKIAEEKENFDNKFRAAKEALEKEYAEKLAALDNQLAVIEQREKDVHKVIEEANENLKTREAAIHDNLLKINAENESIASAKKFLEDAQNSFQREKNEQIQKIEQRAALVQAGVEALAADREAFNIKLQDVLAKEDQFKAVLARLAEIDARETAAKAKEEANAKRQDELNQLSVSLRADSVRMDKRDSEQKQKDKELKKREDDIKVLEAKV